MFTGLVQKTAVVREVEKTAGGKRITLNVVPDFIQEFEIGESIAVNGVCQTVEHYGSDWFSFFSIPETLRITNLDIIQPGDSVNLERALRFSDRLGGHIVSGHVEDLVEIEDYKNNQEYLDFKIKHKSPYIMPKGSVCLDGISLTVQTIDDYGFTVQIIPETIKKTNIQNWRAGSKINLEYDFFVKTVAQLLKNSDLIK